VVWDGIRHFTAKRKGRGHKKSNVARRKKKEFRFTQKLRKKKYFYKKVHKWKKKLFFFVFEIRKLIAHKKN